METQKPTKIQPGGYFTVLPADIWRYMVTNRLLTLAIFLAFIIVGLAVAYIPTPSYKVTARTMTPSVAEVQPLSVLLSQRGNLSITINTENIEISNLNIQEYGLTSIDMVSQLVFFEFLRNLESLDKRNLFMEEQITRFPDKEEEIREAVDSIRHTPPISKRMVFLSAFVHMNSRLDPDSLANLLNDYLAFLDRVTRNTIASFASYHAVSDENGRENPEPLLEPDDFRVMVIDEAATPPSAPSFPNRRLVILVFFLLGCIMSVLVSMVMCIRSQISIGSGRPTS